MYFTECLMTSGAYAATGAAVDGAATAIKMMVIVVVIVSILNAPGMVTIR